MTETQSKPTCIIFDLDGTVCNVEERRRFLTQKPKNWAAWDSAHNIAKDTPVPQVLEVLKSLSVNHTILFVSGRAEKHREVTTNWLHKHIPQLNVNTHNLRMRKDRDFRDDAIVKGEIADEIQKEYEIFAVFDDRQRVVNMWIQRGVFVFDVAQGQGNF